MIMDIKILTNISNLNHIIAIFIDLFIQLLFKILFKLININGFFMFKI